MSARRVRLTIVLATGFTVKESDPSGIRDLYWAMKEKYGAVEVEILYRTWNSKWKNIAGRLHQIMDLDNARTIFIGHSWGCGYGYRQFETEWEKCGRNVDLACLIDPVPRWFKWLIFLNPIGGLSRIGRFGVRNARQILLFRQVNNTPAGRDVKVNEQITTVTRWVYGSQPNLKKHAVRAHANFLIIDDNVTHGSMDEHDDVQSKICEKVESHVRAMEGF